MKTKNSILVLLLMFLTTASKAQFTVEAKYDSSFGSVYVVSLEQAGEKFIRIRRDSANREVQLYNLNHSLWKTISLNNLPAAYNIVPVFDSLGHFSVDTEYNYNYDILYVTQHLFNLDDNVELMYCSGYHTRIINEFGAVIFATDSAGPLVKLNIPQVMKPIYNTAAGTKMILSGWNNEARVFGLPGILNHENELPLIGDKNNPAMSLYPNPAKDYAIIKYELPEGIKEGEIVFYNISGSEIRSLHVDRTFNDLRISTNDLAAGTYFYQLQTSAGKETKKMVVIK